MKTHPESPSSFAVSAWILTRAACLAILVLLFAIPRMSAAVETPVLHISSWLALGADARFVEAREKLVKGKFIVRRSEVRPSELDLPNCHVLWLLCDASSKQKLNDADLTALEAHLQRGGGLMLVTGADEPASALPLLRRLRIVPNGMPSGAKTQALSTPLLNGLRFHTTPARLLDVAEDGLTERILLPNDQTVLAAGPDHAGFRAILGKHERGRVAVIAGGACFEDASLARTKDGASSDNAEILLRLCRWLSGP